MIKSVSEKMLKYNMTFCCYNKTHTRTHARTHTHTYCCFINLKFGLKEIDREVGGDEGNKTRMY
jgi:hypothetical protein